MSYTNINGKIVLSDTASVSPDNGAFRYGVGLFETMLVHDGGIRLKEYHWERLFRGLHQLDFDIPPLMRPDHLEGEVLRTVKRNGLENLCRVRLQLYAGNGGIYGPESKSPIYVIECYPLDASILQINDNGLVTGIAKGISKSNDSLSNLKTSNALVYAMGARQAKKHKWNDALICNTAGNIIESTTANIFWLKGDVIYTPPLSEGCVSGVMRRHILLSSPHIVECQLTNEQLLEADEVFFTNAVKAVRWVRAFENATYSNTRTKTLLANLF